MKRDPQCPAPRRRSQGGPRRSTGLCSALIVLIIGVTFTIVPLAYARPPDDTWIGGFWDDDDFDNVVLAVTSAKVLCDRPLDPTRPVLVILGAVSDSSAGPQCLRPISPSSSRAPPAL